MARTYAFTLPAGNTRIVAASSRKAACYKLFRQTEAAAIKTRQLVAVKCLGANA